MSKKHIAPLEVTVAANPTTPYVLEFRNLSYVYGSGTPFKVTALDDLNFGIERGVITGIIGHTGSGKSTLVQHMNGLLKPTSGQVLLDGVDLWSDKKFTRAARFRVGLVFQYPEYQLFEETVEKDVAFGPRNMGLDKEEIAVRTEEALRFVGLAPDILKKSPFELSGGQKRRVAIAGVMAMRPDVLILDEPAAGLDPMGREEILGGVRAYRRDRGASVVIVSHSMEDMARYADNVIVLRGAKLLASGTTREIFSNQPLLDENNLAAPQITNLLKKIAALGVPVRTDIFTVGEARGELLRLLGKGGAV